MATATRGPRPPSFVRRVLVIGLALAVLAYAGLIGYLAIYERTFIYQPGERHVWPPAKQFALHERAVTYPSTNGSTLSAWVIPASTDADTGMWLLICHGNYGNIGYGQRPEFYALMRDIGVTLLAFDYRGFGDSTGTPDEQGLYDDATTSYEYLTQNLHVRSDHVVIYGHSLGSGVAIELASRKPSAGLIVEGAYTSVVNRAKARYPFLPIDLLSTQRFPSIDRIGSVRVPTLFLHSPEDAVIPYEDGRRLYEAAPLPKRFVDVKGGHENAYRGDSSVYFGAISTFIREVAPR